MKDRIIDVVFAPSATAQKREAFSRAIAVAIVIHGGIVAWAARAEPSLEAWSAKIALSVHDELQNEDVVTLEPEKPQPKPVETPALGLKTSVAAKTVAKAAPAAAVMTANEDGPVDLSANTIVSGTATTPVSGVTAASGVVAPPVDHSSKVTLQGDEWSCAWPSSAAGEVINEQNVTIRVDVADDGSVITASVVGDPKGGFGDAALACAKRTRFVPARDKDGKAVRALSPPITVHFSR